MTKWLSFLVLLALMLGAPYIEAQDIARGGFVAEKTTPLIGEQVTLRLIVEVPQQSVVQLPQISENWPPFTVREIGVVTTSTQNGKDFYEQSFKVLLWQPGDFSTPETLLKYQPPGSQQIFQLIVEPAYFSVASTLMDSDKSLRPLKPPILMPFVPFWIIISTSILVMGLVVWGVRFWRLRRLATLQELKLAGSLHGPAQKAINDLKRLVGQSEDAITIYAQTVDCVRVYLQMRFNVDASDMTTSEILLALKTQQDTPEKDLDELGRLLERADLVKFARAQPRFEAAKQFAGFASQWISRLEQVIDQKIS